MSDQPTLTNGQAQGDSLPLLVLPLDLAMTRWSVKCTAWSKLSPGAAPVLGAFLAGWYCRCIGTAYFEPDQLRDSFRVGWREADDHIYIQLHSQNTPVNPTP